MPGNPAGSGAPVRGVRPLFRGVVAFGSKCPDPAPEPVFGERSEPPCDGSIAGGAPGARADPPFGVDLAPFADGRAARKGPVPRPGHGTMTRARQTTSATVPSPTRRKGRLRASGTG